jgi:hypothetical protein
MVRGYQDFPKYGAILYDTMIDQEYAKSFEIDKSPRMFSLRKEGINRDFWEMDVSFLPSHYLSLPQHIL